MRPLLGKYRAVVDDNADPGGAGRLKVSAPSLGKGTSAWAEPCLPCGMNGPGLLTLPAVGAEIWIEFEEGDPARPIWTGCLWDPAQANLTVTTPAKLDVSAGTVEVAAGMVRVRAGMVKVDGVVQCDTLIATSVVASSYTPGAGNVW